MLTVRTPQRGRDPAGAGHFGASRGRRRHMGIDFAAFPGSILLSPVAGAVTKCGYPYGDDLSYRYIQITDAAGACHRFFYVKPVLRTGARVQKNTPLGAVQDVSERYPIPAGMKPHIHYEIIDVNGLYISPETVSPV